MAHRQAANALFRTPERRPLRPELLTLAETFPGFTSTGFLAIAVPKATPRPIEEKLNTLINEAISSPTIHDRLINEFAIDAEPLSLEPCAAQDREERAKWAEYVKIARSDGTCGNGGNQFPQFPQAMAVLSFGVHPLGETAKPRTDG
jgi:tripartite-type tricarboxylate transporter receptor subunit TctC